MLMVCLAIDDAFKELEYYYPRYAEVIERVATGKRGTMSAIAREWKLSPERIRQINNLGLARLRRKRLKMVAKWCKSMGWKGAQPIVY